MTRSINRQSASPSSNAPTTPHLAVTRKAGWTQIVADEPLSPALLKGPGLWKHHPAGAIFSVPDLPESTPPDESLATDLTRFTPLIAWAICTWNGRLPPGWVVPTRAEVESSLTAGLSVQVGERLAQGELVHIVSPDPRLAIRFPLVSFERSLSQNRQAVIAAILEGASRQFPLVRFRPEQINQAIKVVAEVDFTGAPEDSLPELAACSLEALHLAIRRVLVPLSLAADPNVSARLLDLNLGGFSPANFWEE